MALPRSAVVSFIPYTAQFNMTGQPFPVPDSAAAVGGSRSVGE
jgi:hypothetical protein